MNELALFAGAGGGILGGKLLGWRTICAVESNEHCRNVLMQRQNDGILEPFPIWGDIRSFCGSEWRGIVDVVSGGFPCQRFSAAASGRNNADDLWPDMRRVVANVAPFNVFAENVSKKAIIAAALDCASMGYQTRILAISAKDLGSDHLRERYWLRAYTNNKSQLYGAIDAEMAVRPKLHAGIWQTNPRDSRMADGVADRMERYRATGNGQIPLMAAIAWNTLNS